MGVCKKCAWISAKKVAKCFINTEYPFPQKINIIPYIFSLRHKQNIIHPYRRLLQLSNTFSKYYSLIRSTAHFYKPTLVRPSCSVFCFFRGRFGLSSASSSSSVGTVNYVEKKKKSIQRPQLCKMLTNRKIKYCVSQNYI